MPTGPDFPVSEYYKPYIREGHTITKGGGWWSAALLIDDPKAGKPMVSLYRWQLTEDGWKMRKSFNCRDKEDLRLIIKVLGELEGLL